MEIFMKIRLTVFGLFFSLTFNVTVEAAALAQRAQQAALFAASAATGWALGKIPLSFPSNDYSEHPELTKFLDRYDTPESFRAAINDYKTGNNTQQLPHGVLRLRDSNFYVKPIDKDGRGFDRVLNAQRLNGFIKAHNFENYIGVAEKRLVYVDGQWKVLAQGIPILEDNLDTPPSVISVCVNDKWIPLIFAPLRKNTTGEWEAYGVTQLPEGKIREIPLKKAVEKTLPKGKKLSLEQVKALFRIAEGAGFLDLHPGNLRWTNDGRLMFIDTEDRSLSSGGNIQAAIQNILTQFGYSMTPEAQAWIIEKRKELPAVQNTTSHNWNTPLLDSFKAYGDRNINFDQAQQELKDLIAAQTYQDDYAFRILNPWK